MITFHNSTSIISLTKNDLKKMLVIFELDFDEQVEITDTNDGEITVGVLNKLFVHFNNVTHTFTSAHSTQGNLRLDDEFESSVIESNKDNFQNFMVDFIEYYIELKTKLTKERRKHVIKKLLGVEKANDYLKGV